MATNRRKDSLLYRRSVYAIASLLAIISLGVAVYFTIAEIIPHTTRKQKIESIYTSLNLGKDYALVSADVFGEKRVYEWDSSRTYSSSKTYTRDATVQDTVADVRRSIESAGFTFIDEPYPGSGSIQYHFRSDAGEYIRMTVVSKSYNDAIIQKPSASADSFDQNAAPSSVIIKVNLDDNNE